MHQAVLTQRHWPGGAGVNVLGTQVTVGAGEVRSARLKLEQRSLGWGVLSHLMGQQVDCHWQNSKHFFNLYFYLTAKE